MSLRSLDPKDLQHVTGGGYTTVWVIGAPTEPTPIPWKNGVYSSYGNVSTGTSTGYTGTGSVGTGPVPN